MANVFRRPYTSPIPSDAVPTTLKIKKRGQVATVPAVRYKGRDGRQTTSPLSRDGKKIVVESPHWYGWVSGKSVKLTTNKAASETLLARKITEAANQRAGLINPLEEHQEKPLEDHIEDYKSILQARGGTAKHIRETISNITTILKDIEATYPAELDEVKVSTWVVSRRAGQPVPALPEGLTEFLATEVTSLLGISRSALSSHMRRHNLQATGQGKARRYPRATVEFLLARQSQGLAPKSLNHFIRGIKGFTKWMSGRGRRLPFDPPGRFTVAQ